MQNIVQKATEFAFRIHQINQFQTRKGKVVPYLLHPLSVANRLSRVGAEERIIVAGILHDTIEDCVPYGSVTKEILGKEFGEKIAQMVDNVTEQDKSLPWAERKQAALEHIKEMDQDSLLVKSADVLDNFSDQIEDYWAFGDKMFENYNASKNAQLGRYTKLINELEAKWKESPLLPDLKEALVKAKVLWS